MTHRTIHHRAFVDSVITTCDRPTRYHETSMNIENVNCYYCLHGLSKRLRNESEKKREDKK